MGTVLADLLPLAVGVAISPLPIIAVVLTLLSPGTGWTSARLLGGYLAGLLVVTLIAAGAAASIGMGTGTHPSTGASVVRLVVGLGMILLALRLWRGSPASAKEPELPRWLTAIERLNAEKTVGMGALLSMANPICIAAGVALASANLSAGQRVFALLVFVLIAASSVAIPVVAFAMAPQRMARPLERLKAWLAYHNTAVMVVLLVLIGAILLGKGLAS